MSDSDGNLVISGIDTVDGLRRLGGKRERYESLLRKFADKQSGTVIRARHALQAGDLAAAERELHSLKGAAAVLGAAALADAASDAESALKVGANADEKLEAVSKSLEQVVEAIRATLL